MSMARAATRRDQLIDTALALFARAGYHATGIDRILSEAGVAKMTLYNHFRSKDELILAALHRRDERFRNWFMRGVERRAESPRARLFAIFEVLDEWVRSRDFTGCMFINASAEFADPDHPVHRACAEHKALMRDYLVGLARAAGADRAEALADGLGLLLEGAIVAAHTAGDREAAVKARAAAGPLVEHHLGGA
jgi:AcrR family transcriptional regulator